VTEKVLAEIGADQVPRLRVFNKIDLIGDAEVRAERARTLRAFFPKCLVISAVAEDDIAQLQQAIRAYFRRRLVKAELFLPWSAQHLRGDLFADCEVLDERDAPEGTFFLVRGERNDLESLRERIGQAQGIR
jgi:GTP-binding protein HflX